MMNFQRRVRAFLDSHPEKQLVEKNADGSKTLKYTFRRPSDDFADIAFDAINNARVALDRAMYACVVAKHGPSRKFDKTYFPFGANLQEIVGRRAQSHIPGQIFDLACGFKPYPGGNDTLWALNQICNSGKHVKVQEVGLTTEVMHFLGEGRGVEIRPIWDYIKHELIIATIPPGGALKGKYALRCAIFLDEAPPAGGQPTLSFIRDAIRIVDGILLAVEAEARRIGLFA